MGGVYTSRELLGSKKDWPFSKQAGEAWQFPSCCWPGRKTEGLPWSLAATLSMQGSGKEYVRKRMFERSLYKVVASGNASTNPGDNTSQKRKGSRHRRGNAASAEKVKLGGWLVFLFPSVLARSLLWSPNRARTRTTARSVTGCSYWLFLPIPHNSQKGRQ